MRRSDKKAATREALIRTALDLFARNGFEETTVAQITKEAGVAKGTFFNYFETKYDLLIRVIEEQVAEAKERLAQLADSDLALADELSRIMVGLASPLPYTPALVRAIFRSSLATPEMGSGHVAPAMDLVGAIIPVIALGQERGEFRQDLPAGQIAYLIVQTYFGALWAWAMAPNQESLAQTIAVSYHVFFQGIGQPR